MYNLSKAYNASFFAFRRRSKLEWRIPIVCKAIADNFKLKTLIDVGCARGDYVKGFLEMGIDAWGIEGSPCCIPELLVPQERVMIGDLRKPIKLPDKYDLAMCFEVVEHIEEEYADTVCENLAGLSDKVLITAAKPGQKGHHHYNCQHPEYWKNKMEKVGFKTDWDKAEKIKQSFSHTHRREIVVYASNLIYFEREI